VSTFSWALLGHLVGALCFFSGMAVAGSAQGAAMRRRRPSEIAALLGVTRVGVVLVGLGSLLLVAFGIWLADLGDHSFRAGWLASALALFALAVVLGSAGGRRPRRARLLATQLAGSGDAPSEELAGLVADRASLALNGAALAASLAVLALMVLRPGGG
jgi:uncharacterized membrane protein